MKIAVNTSGRVYLELTDGDLGTILKTAHPSKFTTRQLLDRMVGIWNANFEQDAHDALADLEETEA